MFCLRATLYAVVHRSLNENAQVVGMVAENVEAAATSY
jgi:hypothetical protein